MLKLLKNIFYSIVCLLVSYTTLCSQSSLVSLDCRYIDDHDSIIETIILEDFKRKEVNRFLDSLILSFKADEYIGASLDTLIEVDDSNLAAVIYKGVQYDFSQIDHSATDSIVDSKNISRLNDYDRYQQGVLKKLSEDGYPFAAISLDSLSIYDNKVDGITKLDKGIRIKIDSIKLLGDSNVSNRFISRYLEIEKGDLFDHSKLLKVDKRLQDLAFINIEKPTELTFVYDKAILNVYAQDKNASRFDFLFGIIPTNEDIGSNIFLSFDVATELINMLGAGEYFLFEFERLRPEQQNLQLKMSYPYILDLPIAIDGQLNMFRNSVDYLNLNADIGLRYLLGGENYVKVAWNIEDSRIIDIDTMQVLNFGLPQNLDVSNKGLYIEALFSTLDYKYNPRKGIRSISYLGGGLRTIKPNQTILSFESDKFDFDEEYQKLDLDNYRLDLRQSFAGFIPLAQRATVTMQLMAGWKYSASKLRFNELFQIGGHELLRGFDEASIFTDLYIIPTLEYRLLLSQNSYLTFPFIDFTYLNQRNTITGEDTWKFGIGLGGGMSFETNVGLFNFSIGVGKLGDQNFDFGKPKAHFGFVSLF